MFRALLRYPIGSVWIFHGLCSKILGLIPRHEQIVARILGDSIARPATILIGLLEICLGLWAISGHRKIACAAVQTSGIVAMNTIEILRAPDLLISAPGMVALNAVFLSLVWWWALTPANPPAPARRP